MPDLDFAVVGAEVPAYAAAPMLLFRLQLINRLAEEAIQSVVLRAQIQIEAARRRYSPAAQARLLEVFGEPERWGETLRSLLWAHAGTVVPAFSGRIEVDLPVACTYDFEVVSTKYFAALEGEEGVIPLRFLFSGTIFYESENGRLQVAPVPWSKEAAFALPLRCWQELIAHFYPGSAWIRLQRQILDRLAAYKLAHGLPTWDETMLRLLEVAEREEREG
ncbi:DUF6084 family protein [Thermogemmatispora sp.]|uniref:DUF6084 family protein n=1 Tax=Thermogemmatispora sp. TaxID=1968838 RepID=UPI001D82FC12|nr:DUF6084 family protein [Thermogemmatispora sp.]MBX5448521.1 hypothetical protein [Thermogemmatispora sp.]